MSDFSSLTQIGRRLQRTRTEKKEDKDVLFLMRTAINTPSLLQNVGYSSHRDDEDADDHEDVDDADVDDADVDDADVNDVDDDDDDDDDGDGYGER